MTTLADFAPAAVGAKLTPIVHWAPGLSSEPQVLFNPNEGALAPPRLTVFIVTFDTVVLATVRVCALLARPTSWEPTVTLVVQWPPGASGEPQVFIVPKDGTFPPLSDPVFTDRTNVPVFVTLICCAALVVPIGWPLKLSDVALSVATGTGVPASASIRALPFGLP